MATRAIKLSTVIANLACDAVRIQERLDEAADEAESSFVRTLSTVPERGRDLLLPLAPARRVVTEHRIRCTIQAGMSRDARALVMVAPARLGLYAAYGERQQTTSTLEIWVVREPGPPLE